MSSVRLLIAADQAVVRQGIRQILTDAPEIQIAGEAATGMEALELMRDADIDLVILDLSMPGLSGLDIVRQMRQDRPLVRILVLSVHPEEQYAVRVMKAGASGYLTKDSAPEELISAVRHIAAGHKYVTATLAERLALELDNAGDKLPHQSLSDREYEVMLLVAEGLKVQEIADRLSLSVKTVSTYRTRLLQKMRMRNNAELVRHAVRQRLVDE